MVDLIRINNVYRDGIQSLLGTNPSADEIVAAVPNAHRYGCASTQTTGGTFFDLPAKKGRDEWDFNDTITSHFGEKGVRQTALIRNDCLFGYRPQPFDVVKATVREFSRMGINVFQNFHGLNYVPAMNGVAEAVRQVREEEGLDVVAHGTLCIETNKNVTLDSCLKAAKDLLKTHSGLYLKSASGVLDAGFAYNLVSAIGREFGDVPLDIHVHGTYGRAALCYMAAIEAAIEQDHHIGIDCQHPAFSGLTAHPSMLLMARFIADHPNGRVRENAPVLNTRAIEADDASLRLLRRRYGATETRYNSELLEVMEDARIAGGASATLKAIPGLLKTLEGKLGTQDWDQIQKAIYEEQGRIIEALGDPTQVTPYAMTTTNEAACRLMGLQAMHPDTAFYLAGGLGAVPESADPELVQKALEQLNLDAPLEYVPSAGRENGLPQAKAALIEAGIENPTTRQQVSAATLKGGVDHVVAVARGINTPQPSKELPDYASLPLVSPLTELPRASSPLQSSWMQSAAPGIGNTDLMVRQQRFVQALGGLEEIARMGQRALHMRQIEDDFQHFPVGQDAKGAEWHDKYLVRLNKFVAEDIPDALETSAIGKATFWHASQMMKVLETEFDLLADGLWDHVLTMSGANPLLDLRVEASERREEPLSADAA